MTVNVELSTTELTKITGLTDDKTYFLQGFYNSFGGGIDECAIEVIQSDTTPADDLQGLRNSFFKITKKTDVDIYVKGLNTGSIAVIEEC